MNTTPRPRATLRAGIEAANLGALDAIDIDVDLRGRILEAASAAMRAELDGRIEPQQVAMSPEEHAELVGGLTRAGLAMHLGMVRVSLVLSGPAISAPHSDDAHFD